MSYLIDYEKALNPAQLAAVTFGNGPLLVIAGAGSGKTRTLVYRMARLVEDGVDPASILLLTFTRKAAAEMTRRASELLAGAGQGNFQALAGPAVTAVRGGPEYGMGRSLQARSGTFHSFAYSVLRRFKPASYPQNPSLMDASDMLSALQQGREKLGLGKGDRSFPKNQAIVSLLSKCRNKESDLEGVLRGEAMHLMPYAEDLNRLAQEYAVFKQEHSLLDYDDLLFELEKLLLEQPEVLALQREIFSHIMVDEYQDTNRVQARLTRLLAGEGGNILAVGDDAQSIYAFRGADVQNILDFPHLFPGAKVITLEQNYRSVQPILTLTNSILASARASYPKNLFSDKPGGLAPKLIKPISDMSQATMLVKMINELLCRYPAREIAVLFRSGFHSYNLEVQLTRAGIAFRKYGGVKYSDAAHVKDVMSMARLLLNPLDLPSFVRLASLFRGIGPKTAQKLYTAAASGDMAALSKAGAKFPDFLQLLKLIGELRSREASPATLLEEMIKVYQPLLQANYPEDYPYREQALEELLRIAQPYAELDLLVADLSLEDPTAEEEHEGITLSTVHSAKGLEWSAVLVIDLVHNRFPSRHALLREDDYEEERRLLYVACTRAREELCLFAPATVYHREHGGHEPVNLSPFLEELPPVCYEEWLENYGGTLRKKESGGKNGPAASQRLATGGGASKSPWLNVYGGQPADDFDSASPFALPSKKMPWGSPQGPEADFDPEEAEASKRVNTPHSSAAPDPNATHNSGLLSPLKMKDGQSGYCTHRIFGRGKIVQHIPPDKYRVNFPGFGLKVIMANYLTLEEES